MYLHLTEECVCRRGFVSVSGSTDLKDSEEDCMEIIYSECDQDEEIDITGKCRKNTDCSAYCNGGSGRVVKGLGPCQCDQTTQTDDVCDASCQKDLGTVTFTSGSLVARSSAGATAKYGQDGYMGGELKCVAADTSNCQVSSLGKDPETGDYLATYEPEDGIKEAEYDALVKQTSSGNSTDGESATRRRRRLYNGKDIRFMQEATEEETALASEQNVLNPVVCIVKHAALLFGGVSASNYPVYVKDSLLNTNPDFDYSAFLTLRDDLETGAEYTSFVHVFNEAGIFVFADSSNAEKVTVVAVMGESKTCPGGTAFEAMTEQALLMVGVTRSDDILYEPEWAFLFITIAVLLVLILASVLVISYFYQKTWLQEYWKGPFKYQQIQGKSLKNDNVYDPEALVSIHADNSAFEFLHENSNVMSSDDIFKRKLAENTEEAEAERLRQERKRKRRGQ